MAQATFRIWRGGSDGTGAFKDYSTEVSEGMVVLDAVHRVQADQAPDLACRWNCKAGKCGSCSAEVNGQPRLMCMTRLNMLPADKPITVEPMHAFPHLKDLVGIVRLETEMKEALTRLTELNRRADASGVDGHREYHSGWHTCLDLRNLLAVSEAITLSAIERKESRGGHFRDDFPDKDPAFGTFNVAVGRNADGTMRVSRIPIPDMPPELKQVIEDQKQ